MDDYALVLNARSTRLKFWVFQRPDGESWRLDASGKIEGIGTSGSLCVKGENGESLARQDVAVRDVREAVAAVAVWLRSKYGEAHVLGVGHRVVHGGARFTRPTIINERVLSELSELIPLAPLHQPYNLTAIEAAIECLPAVPQVACFDTSFHCGRSAVAELIPLPRELRISGLQRYGFHGLSYEYIASVLPGIAPEIAKRRVIVAHLGSSASLCALKEGKSVDGTFGFTALDGLCMGTRPGSLDPGVILYLFQRRGLSVKEIETLLYEKSGLLAVSRISSNMRDLIGRREPRAHLAVDYFVYRAAKEIAALTAVLRGIDALVFTAGIGENSAVIRKRICEACRWLGVELDEVGNANRNRLISTERSKVSVWVIPTNPALMIAQHTGSLLGRAKAVP